MVSGVHFFQSDFIHAPVTGGSLPVHPEWNLLKVFGPLEIFCHRQTGRLGTTTLNDDAYLPGQHRTILETGQEQFADLPLLYSYTLIHGVLLSLIVVIAMVIYDASCLRIGQWGMATAATLNAISPEQVYKVAMGT